MKKNAYLEELLKKKAFGIIFKVRRYGLIVPCRPIAQ
jgi:hypothetical protein